MDEGMDGGNNASGRSILGSTICIEAGGILLIFFSVIFTHVYSVFPRE